MFLSKFKIALLSIFSIFLMYGTSFAESKQSNITDCICPMEASYLLNKNLLELYITLENAVRENALTEKIENIRRSLLEYIVFPALPDKKDPAYHILIRKIYTVASITDEDLEKINTNNLNWQWQDLIAFLRFYNPKGEYYQKLTPSSNKGLVDALYARFGYLVGPEVFNLGINR